MNHFTITTRDGSTQPIPKAAIEWSTFLEEFAEAFDEDDNPAIDLPLLSSTEGAIYEEWCRVRVGFPQIEGISLLSRVNLIQTLETMLGEELAEALGGLFMWEMDVMIPLCAKTPRGSPFNDPPDWLVQVPPLEIPTEFPDDLTQAWQKKFPHTPTPETFPRHLVIDWMKLHYHDTPDNMSDEDFQMLVSRTSAFIETTPDHSPNDRMWGVGNKLMRLSALAKKMGDILLQDLTRWRNTELSDLMESTEMRMRYLKYHHTPRLEQLFEECLVH